MDTTPSVPPALDISASMISCRARDDVRAVTRASWARSDWGAPPRVELDWRNEGERYLVGAPEAAWGAQALVMSRRTLRYVVQRWNEVNVCHQDIRIARLAGRLSRVYYHAPSLVQHTGVASTWGNPYHRSDGFSSFWRG